MQHKQWSLFLAGLPTKPESQLLTVQRAPIKKRPFLPSVLSLSNSLEICRENSFKLAIWSRAAVVRSPQRNLHTEKIKLIFFCFYFFLRRRIIFTHIRWKVGAIWFQVECVSTKGQDFRFKALGAERLKPISFVRWSFEGISKRNGE